MSHILFVCTGNICRSPMAAGMLRAGLIESGQGTLHTVESAGIQAVVDAPPTANALKVAASYGVDIRAHRARAFDQADFQRFEFIFALDSGHLDFLREVRPGDCRAELSLLPSARGQRKLEIADPYGRSRSAYQRSARLIAEGVGVILAGMLERASAARWPALSGRGR
jgi:protein-tyrosine phosphatase